MQWHLAMMSQYPTSFFFSFPAVLAFCQDKTCRMTSYRCCHHGDASSASSSLAAMLQRCVSKPLAELRPERLKMQAAGRYYGKDHLSACINDSCCSIQDTASDINYVVIVMRQLEDTQREGERFRKESKVSFPTKVWTAVMLNTLLLAVIHCGQLLHC